jgi:hypothetical protein
LVAIYRRPDVGEPAAKPIGKVKCSRDVPGGGEASDEREDQQQND